MSRTILLFLTALVCACSTPTVEEAGKDERGMPEPGLAIVRNGDLPAGEFLRTSRSTDFESMCEELAKADVVYVGESAGSTHRVAVELQIIRQLHARVRLDGIGLAVLARPTQPALDDYTRGRIEWAELSLRIPLVVLESYRPILEFAREHRIGVIALDMPQEIMAAVTKDGRDSLPEAERRQLPAESEPIAGYDEFVAERARRAGEAAEPYARARRLTDDYRADSVVRWMARSPRDVQFIVLAGRDRVAHPWGMPAQVRGRGGRTHKSVVLLDKTARSEQQAQSYADFVFTLGE